MPWPQFSSSLVEALHAAGLRVCAYQRALARRPASEARVLARTVRLGADCLVIDAEIEYQGRYAAARSYMRSLRRAIGPSFPVGLTSFPYVDLHGNFPYSVFLGPGGAQVNLPQMYWRLLGTAVGGRLRADVGAERGLRAADRAARAVVRAGARGRRCGGSARWPPRAARPA